MIGRLNGGRRGDPIPVFLRVMKNLVGDLLCFTIIVPLLITPFRRALYHIVSFVGGTFRFKNAEVDVRYGRVAHSYCCVIVSVVKLVELEM